MTARIVVGIDGSQSSHAALETALREARCLDATVEAVLAHQTHLPSYGIGPMVIPMPSSGELQAAAERSLAEVVAAHPTDVRVEQIVVDGPAARSLLDVAEGADLLVVGSRGRGGFVGLLLGSTSQHVVTHAPCPVLVVPAG